MKLLTSVFSYIHLFLTFIACAEVPAHQRTTTYKDEITYWQQFFESAGIPPIAAADYAKRWATRMRKRANERISNSEVGTVTPGSFTWLNLEASGISDKDHIYKILSKTHYLQPNPGMRS